MTEGGGRLGKGWVGGFVVRELRDICFSFVRVYKQYVRKKKKRKKEQSEVKVKIYIITSSVSLSIYGSLSHSSLSRSIVVLVKKA